MRRFSFTLESVLVVKQKKLEDERIKLAKISDIYNRQKKVLQDITASFEKLQKQADEYAQYGSFNIEIITSFKNYSFKLENDIKAQEELIKKTSIELSNRQKETNKAYIEVKTLEKLKEKQKEQYNVEFLQEEIKTLDDITSSRYLKTH